ncbi:MAG: glycosyltransferase [Candidatus Eiseniibacteriota bacterium]|nr:MAG: glycosyltransferase [Candidatus Eisenbacteria bacterium]
MAHLVDTLRPGGAEGVAVKYANRLAKQGIEVHLVASRYGGSLEAFVAPRVRLFIAGRKSVFDIAGFARLLKYLKESGIQIVHSHNSSSALLSRVLNCLLPRRAPCLVTHDHHGPANRQKWKMRLCFAGTKCHFVVSDTLGNWARDLYGVDTRKIRLLPNAVDLEEFPEKRNETLRAAYAIPKGSLVLACVANFRPEKEHLLLAKALSRLPERGRITTLLVGQKINPRHLQAVEAAFSSCGHDYRILLDCSNVSEILRGSDIGILTSSVESGPVAVLEYMAAGLPFVAPDVGMCIDMLKGLGALHPLRPLAESCGTIFPASQLDGCLKGLSLLVKAAADERKNVGRRGRALVAKHFAVESRVENIMVEYQNILRRVSGDVQPNKEKKR